jgi:hypothetical protein
MFVAVKKIVTEAVYEDLFAELVATVKVPDPLPVAPGIVLECPTKDQLEGLQAAVDETAAQKIIFGAAYDDAMKVFGAAPVGIWNAFMERYNTHFFGDKDQGK